MLKGTPLSMRNINWHRKHILKLKHREKIRKLHLLANRIVLKPTPKKVAKQMYNTKFDLFLAWLKDLFGNQYA